MPELSLLHFIYSYGLTQQSNDKDLLGYYIKEINFFFFWRE